MAIIPATITLNGKQIRDLAEFAGFTITPRPDDDFESQYTISECPFGGLTDDGINFESFEYVVHCEECPEEGFSGLGDEI